LSSNPARRPLAAIFGCAGPTLGDAERRFFRAADPWGFILFQRNCENPEQVRALTAALREAVCRDAPVLIDQEGGRVQRLKPPRWRQAPPALAFAARDPEALRLNIRLIAAELAALGIDVDCVPCLDVPAPGAHDIIGDRAFGRDPALVARLGRVACEALLEGGVLPVVKHVPGHGRARADSHLELPRVQASLAELRATDFAPFRALKDMPLAMTAHVVYDAVDPDAPATASAAVVRDVIRGWIGFDGLLMSDDLNMKALSGSLADRARSALAAGCDVALHCSGALAEMEEVAAALGRLDDAGARRADAALALRRRPAPFDAAAALARLDAMMGTSA
jgi:beta-N-acetylhexosaminidase